MKTPASTNGNAAAMRSTAWKALDGFLFPAPYPLPGEARGTAAVVSFAVLGRSIVVARRTGSSRRGLSLLEVMLALAILGGALAVIGELTRLGARNAEMARDQTIAQRLCANKVAEISAGLVMPQTVTMAPVEELEDQEEWVYSIEVEQLQQTGMIGVWVTVEQNPDRISRPVNFTLVRWMMDPQYVTTTDDSSTGTTSSSALSATGSSAATSAGGTP